MLRLFLGDDFPAEHWVHLRPTNPMVILSRPSPPCDGVPGLPEDIVANPSSPRPVSRTGGWLSARPTSGS